MQSTLACQHSSAARAFDRGSVARTIIYDVEIGLQHLFGRTITEPKERRSFWGKRCRHLLMAFGTDGTWLYDACNKTGRLPDERRVALDSLDARVSFEQFGDVIRWVLPITCGLTA